MTTNIQARFCRQLLTHPLYPSKSLFASCSDRAFRLGARDADVPGQWLPSSAGADPPSPSAAKMRDCCPPLSCFKRDCPGNGSDHLEQQRQWWNAKRLAEIIQRLGSGVCHVTHDAAGRGRGSLANKSVVQSRAALRARQSLHCPRAHSGAPFSAAQRTRACIHCVVH